MTKALSQGIKPTNCDQARFDGSARSSFSLHADDDGDGKGYMEYLNVVDGRCASASITGSVKYVPNEDDVVSVADGASARFREKTATSDRELQISPAGGGALIRTYRHNGVSAAYDADARSWFATFLPNMLAESAVRPAPRVARWMSNGGIANVIANIERLHTTNAMRVHYEALLDNNQLTREQAAVVALSALRRMRSSSYDVRTILIRTRAPALSSPQVKAALEGAVASATSSYDQTTILRLFAEAPDRESQLEVVRLSITIAGEGDKGRFLISLAPSALALNDADINDAFLRSASTILASGDRSRALRSAVNYAAHSEQLTRGIVQGSRGVQSSSDRSRLLISLYESGAVRTPALRDAFMVSASEITDESDRSRVLQVANNR